jgi:hypothetical protein
MKRTTKAEAYVHSGDVPFLGLGDFVAVAEEQPHRFLMSDLLPSLERTNQVHGVIQ